MDCLAFGSGEGLAFLVFLSCFLSPGLSRIGVDAGLLRGSYSGSNLLGSGTVMAKVMPTARSGGGTVGLNPLTHPFDGLSPRLRGNPLDDDANPVNRRSIPLAHHSLCRPPAVPPKAPADRPPTSRLPEFEPGSSRL